MLNWETLLSATRYGHPADRDPNRSDFHRDFDQLGRPSLMADGGVQRRGEGGGEPIKPA